MNFIVIFIFYKESSQADILAYCVHFFFLLFQIFVVDVVNSKTLVYTRFSLRKWKITWGKKKPNFIESSMQNLNKY